MDFLLKEKIKRRALEVLHITQRLLLDDESCYEVGEAYRFAFLVLRRPKKYLETFEAGELAIDAKAVADVYWHYRNEISHDVGLSTIERSIIAEHNQAVETLRQPPDYSTRNCRSSSHKRPYLDIAAVAVSETRLSNANLFQN